VTLINFRRGGVRVLLCAGVAIVLAAAASTACAQTSRLTLMLTTAINDGSGNQCVLAPDTPAAVSADAALVITERDVVEWNPVGARWKLDPARFSETGAGDKLTDHCFVLSIDGKRVSTGVALSANTAQLTGYPTLNVIAGDGALTLQLTSGNHHHISLLHAAQLEDVFGNPTNLTRQLAQIKGYDYDGASRRWSEAVRLLIVRKAIRAGMSISDATMLLGAPTSTAVTEQGKSYSWYFNTPMHVNPLFMIQTRGDIVSAYGFDRR
jgi:hypothetical protein